MMIEDGSLWHQLRCLDAILVEVASSDEAPPELRDQLHQARQATQPLIEWYSISAAGGVGL